MLVEINTESSKYHKHKVGNHNKYRGGFECSMKWVIETITTTCLIVLPIDLLYIYYAGGWREPNAVILWAELGLLYLLPFFAIWRLGWILGKVTGRRRMSK